MATEYLAGWYIDPSDSTRVRYWTGTVWTKDTWNLADVDHRVLRDPAPPLSIVDDNSSSWEQAGFDDTSHRDVPGGGRRLLYGFIGVLMLAAAAAAAWVAWDQLRA